jgi:SAM-dependent methyltransferase
MPKIIVMVSLYEPLPFLEGKVAALNQADLKDCLVYFSDCSSEPTADACREILKKATFTYDFDHHLQRQTLYWTWNHIINKTWYKQAKYICNSNVDDLLAPGYFQTMAARLDANPGLQILACPWYTTHKRNQLWPPEFHNETVPDLRITCGHFPMWRASLHRPDDVGLFNPEFEAMGDAEFWFRIRKKYGTGALGILPKIMGCYLAHDNNLYARADKLRDMALLPAEMRPRGVSVLQDKFHCRRCSGGNMKRVKTTNPNTAQYWDNVYSSEKGSTKIRVDKDRLEQLHRWIKIRFEELSRYPYVLDVGCGLAEVERHFAKIQPVIRFKGVDISPQTINACQQEHSRPGVTYAVGTADDLPGEDEAYDLVWCGETLEHLDDPEAAIKELARVTGQGGLLVLSVPYRGRNRSNEHVWEFEPDDAARWAKSIGDLVFLDCRVCEGWYSMFIVIRKDTPDKLS